MGASTKSISPVKQAESTPNQYAGYASICRVSGRVLWVFSITFGLLLVAGGQLQAAGHFNSQRDTVIDSRWLPWIGSWRLVSNAVNTTDKDLKGDYLVNISPGKRETAVTMKAFHDETVLFEDTIVADGSSQPLKDKECSGWYKYSWSDTGKRLLFESESSCPGELPWNISGISVIDDRGEWLDIQLLQGQNERIITIRRYSLIDKTEDLARYGIRATRRARLVSGADFSINEIIELSNKVASEVLQVALMELHKPFKINSKILMRLADAGVPTPVIDLMVALSFPKKFHIERDTVSIAEITDSTSSGSGSGYSYPPYLHYTVVDPFFPWYWTPSTYSLYWNSGWGVWPGVYYGYYSGPGSQGGDGQRNSGRLVAGRGYTRVNPRDASSAQPRSADQGNMLFRGSSRSGSSSTNRTYSRSNSRVSPSTGSSSAAPPPSSGGSSSGSSGGGSPSASPSGYSSDRAQPR